MSAFTAVPEPGIVPDLMPSMSPDALIAAAVEDAFEDVRIGVSFGTRRIYTYTSPPLVHVGSVVIVPPSHFNPDPQVADVVTLDPPPYHGPVKRVLAVLS